MSYKDNYESKFPDNTKLPAEGTGEQKSYIGWVVGAMVLLGVGLVVVLLSPHGKSLDQGSSINGDQSTPGVVPPGNGTGPRLALIQAPR